MRFQRWFQSDVRLYCTATVRFRKAGETTDAPDDVKEKTMVAVTYGTARIAASPATKAQSKGKGFFARLLDAMVEARMRQARREIAMHQHLVWKSDVNPVDKELPFGR
jgi:hypothetical protein